MIEVEVLMSFANKQISTKIIKLKGFVFSVLAILVLTSLANTNVQATVPIPSGFQLVPPAGTGVRVYKKTYSNGAPDYITVVDLSICDD